MQRRKVGHKRKTQAGQGVHTAPEHQTPEHRGVCQGYTAHAVLPETKEQQQRNVAHAHMMSVTPSMNGRMESRNGMLLSVRMSVDPALVLIAAALMTTHPQQGRDIIGSDVGDKVDRKERIGPFPVAFEEQGIRDDPSSHYQGEAAGIERLDLTIGSHGKIPHR